MMKVLSLKNDEFSKLLFTQEIFLEDLIGNRNLMVEKYEKKAYEPKYDSTFYTEKIINYHG